MLSVHFVHSCPEKLTIKDSNIKFLESKTDKNAWFDTFPCAITATDENGIIMNMNNASRIHQKMRVGYDLVGHSAITCHKEPTQTKVRKFYAEQKSNIYSITKDGKKHLVYQAACFTDGKFRGIVEMVLDLSEEVPHFNRDIPSDSH
ncbi:MAG TPA: hypothetical protein VMW28_00125 [Pelolinea sp.]|nr:hypothetical protein [Pelolinea sp.]